MAGIKLISSSKCYDGFQKVYSHKSDELKCEMKFSIFIPPQACDKKLPVLFWLSGLTCTERNFIEKSGFQRHAAKYGIIVVGPDTSPRGCNVEGEEDSWDFGTGAGFYVDAITANFKDHYRMYSYVTKELPNLIHKEFPTNGKMSISGHSMGGHGAIICTLKNPGKYVSTSAFSPISNPSAGPWGQKAFTGYLGEDRALWESYDSTYLAKVYNGESIDILIEQGEDDEFLKKELLPENFELACKNTKVNPILNMRKGYDHGYYFVSTFLGDHFAFHGKLLNQ